MLTVGLIGAGRIGRVHASTISMHAHSKLVAVADVIEDNAQKLARDFGGQARLGLQNPLLAFAHYLQ